MKIRVEKVLLEISLVRVKYNHNKIWPILRNNCNYLKKYFPLPSFIIYYGNHAFQKYFLCICRINIYFQQKPQIIKIIVNYKYIICQQNLNSIFSNVIICFTLTPFLTLPSQPLLPSPLQLQNFITLNGSLMSVFVCVCVQIWHLLHMRDRR